MNSWLCDRRRFLKLAGLGVLAGSTLQGAEPVEQQDGGSCFPQFRDAGERFRFAICADPQVGHLDNESPVAARARDTQIQAVRELNAMTPKPLFVVFLGDLTNVFDEKSVACFEHCIHEMEPQAVLVHGNHDTRPPYGPFRDLVERTCGFRDVFYSFDVGRWHFVVIPCNLNRQNQEARDTEALMLDWLKQDLARCADRPTIILEHLHAMPQGMTQLEWYTFPLDLRLRLIDLFTRHGNVKWHFNGHVHNGFKASVKTSWEYNGIRFVNAPTIIQSRNFGEEYPEFQSGLENGGYYLVVDVDGDAVSLTGRLAGLEKEYVYPDRFCEYHDDIEPRWFRRAATFPGAPALANGRFEDGLSGWGITYRYVADIDPGFVWETKTFGGKPGAYLFVKAKEPLFWANDEMLEIYQSVEAPSEDSPVLRASYHLASPPTSGGGYIRLAALRDDEFLWMMMFKWGERERFADNLVRAFANMMHGRPLGWSYLQDLGREKKGLYWNLPATPGQWHELSVDIPTLYDTALGAPGAYARGGVDKFFLALGVWVNKDDDASSGAFFSDISLASEAVPPVSQISGAALVCDDSVFKTEFGQELMDRVAKARRPRRTSRRSVEDGRKADETQNQPS